jgi:hypothetical protein
MSKKINEDMFDDILASGPKQYFFQKEEDGEVTVIFESGIHVTDPGDTDLVGRVWNPPVVDANGNPMLNFNGQPRQPWSKVEAEAVVKGTPMVYSFGGKESGLFRAWIGALRANEVKNDELPGTKWTCIKTGKWNWTINYIGKEEISSSPSKTGSDTTEVKKILSDLKMKNPLVTKGVAKNQLVKTIALLSGKSQEEIDSMWYKLINEKVIVEKDGKVSVL